MNRHKLGILGGTFNPIHNGHLKLAQCAYEQFHLNQVLVIPNHMPIYKNRGELLSTDYRREMIQLAIKDYSYMMFSDIEIKRAGPTYSIDTVRELHKLYPDAELYFIIGGDSLVHFQEWHEYQALLRECRFICAPRQTDTGDGLAEAGNILCRQVPEARIYFLSFPVMDISSTEIRAAIHQQQSTAKWLPPAVRAYIDRHHLYTVSQEKGAD